MSLIPLSVPEHDSSFRLVGLEVTIEDAAPFRVHLLAIAKE